jgi:hypothetical protein
VSVYPSLYKAQAVDINGSSVTAFIPQVFGDAPVQVREFIGAKPTRKEMGWVLFQAGNAAHPVWASGITVSGTTVDQAPAPGTGYHFQFQYNFNNTSYDGGTYPPAEGELRLQHTGIHYNATGVAVHSIDANGKDVSGLLRMVMPGSTFYIYDPEDPDTYWQGFTSQYGLYIMTVHFQSEAKNRWGGDENFLERPIILEVLPAQGINAVNIGTTAPSNTYDPYVELWVDISAAGGNSLKYKWANVWSQVQPPPVPWITPTLSTPWVNRAGETVQYRKVGDIVYIRGNPIGQAGNTMFVLPTGYRPAQTTRFSTVSFVTSEATASRGDITTAGLIVPQSPGTSNSIWQMDGIQFSVTA